MSEESNVVQLIDYLRRQIEQATHTAKAAAKIDGGDGDGPADLDMKERLAKVEGIIEGLRSMQTLTLSAIGIVVALVLAFGIYGVKRMDDLGDKITNLPGQITRDLRDLTTALSSAITASKQQPPQIILMPAPTIPPQAPPKSP